MPVISKERPTKTISLPSYPDAKIEIYSFARLADVKDFDGTKGTVDFTLMVLPKLIKDWNLTDENKVKLPITRESIEMLPAIDVQSIAESFSLSDKIEKKV